MRHQLWTLALATCLAQWLPACIAPGCHDPTDGLFLLLPNEQLVGTAVANDRRVALTNDRLFMAPNGSGNPTLWFTLDEILRVDEDVEADRFVAVRIDGETLSFAGDSVGELGRKLKAAVAARQTEPGPLIGRPIRSEDGALALEVPSSSDPVMQRQGPGNWHFHTRIGANPTDCAVGFSEASITGLVASVVRNQASAEMAVAVEPGVVGNRPFVLAELVDPQEREGRLVSLVQKVGLGETPAGLALACASRGPGGRQAFRKAFLTALKTLMHTERGEDSSTQRDLYGITRQGVYGAYVIELAHPPKDGVVIERGRTISVSYFDNVLQFTEGTAHHTTTQQGQLIDTRARSFEWGELLGTTRLTWNPPDAGYHAHHDGPFPTPDLFLSAPGGFSSRSAHRAQLRELVQSPISTTFTRLDYWPLVDPSGPVVFHYERIEPVLPEAFTVRSTSPTGVETRYVIDADGRIDEAQTVEPPVHMELLWTSANPTGI